MASLLATVERIELSSQLDKDAGIDVDNSRLVTDAVLHALPRDSVHVKVTRRALLVMLIQSVSRCISTRALQ